MKKILITSLTLTASAVAAHAQVLNQWNFADTNGTDFGSAVDSAGSASFGDGVDNDFDGTIDVPGAVGGGPFVTSDGSIVGLNRFGNADIANVTTGAYQYDLTGVQLTSFTGGTDDFAFFSIRSGASATNTSFTTSSGTFDQAAIVFGNENSGGGLDVRIIDNGAEVFAASDITADFSGTFDFRILLDLDNDTADYLYRVDGGSYNNIGTQQFNGLGEVGYLALGSGGFGATLSIDQVTWSAVPEPSAYALLSGALALTWVMIRRRK